MLLEFTTAMNFIFHSFSANAKEAPARVVVAAQESTTTSTSQASPATPNAATTAESEASGESASAQAATADAPTKSASPKKRKRRRGKTRGSGHATNRSSNTKKLPAYQGTTKRESSIQASETGEENEEANNESSNGKTVSKNKKSRYKDPTEVPLPGSAAYGTVPANTPGKGEVSEADLAPGPIIKNGKVTSTIAGEENATELDPSERSALRFGLHAGESLTKYKNLDSNAKEGALLVGAQLGLATDLWDDLQLFGIPLSGEENIRLDYVTSFATGVAQMIQMRIDSVLFLGSDLDHERGLTPLIGLGLGWGTAELRSTATPTQSARTHAQGVIFVPQVGARWRFTERAAFDLKVQPLFATDSKLSSFGKLSAELGFLIFL